LILKQLKLTTTVLGGTSYSRTVMDQLRRDFLHASPLKAPQQNEQSPGLIKSNNLWEGIKEKHTFSGDQI